MLKDNVLSLEEAKKVSGGGFNDDTKYVFQCVCFQCPFKGDITNSTEAMNQSARHVEETGHGAAGIQRFLKAGK